MQDKQWVSAAPFRAHLRFVCDSASVSGSMLALHAGLPVGLVHQLLDTRPGRQVQRIAPELAELVLAITVESVQRLRYQFTPGRGARQAARRLVQLGWPAHVLARRAGISVAHLNAILAGLSPEVTTLVDLRLRALLAVAEPAPSRRPGPHRAA